MTQGQIRIDLFGTFGSASSKSLILCPDAGTVLCDEASISYQYIQDISWIRLSPALTIGLGRGLQVALNAPFDRRLLGITSSTLDGDAYIPPGEEDSSWSGARIGPADAQLLFGWYTMLGTRWLIGGGLGSTIPTGTTKPYPIELEVEGLARRPMIMGSGTFQPLGNFSAIVQGQRWGAYFNGSFLLPLYANSDGYRSPRSVEVNMGPSFRVIPPMQTLVTLVWGSEGPGLYDGVTLGGQHQVSASVTMIYALSGRLTLQVEGRARIAEFLMDETAIAGTTPKASFSFGMTWTFGREGGLNE